MKRVHEVFTEQRSQTGTYRWLDSLRRKMLELGSQKDAILKTFQDGEGLMLVRKRPQRSRAAILQKCKPYLESS